MSLSSSDSLYLRDLVRKHAAIVIEADKEYLFQTRLAPVARQAGYESLALMVAELKTKSFGAAHQQVIEALTTNETSFFRDRQPFDVLKTVVLPDLITRRASEKRLTIWSAASSSGQEAYSIAMILKDTFDKQLADWDVRIVASDISREMVQRSKDGMYSQLEVNRGLPANMLVRYFENAGNNWRVRADLRAMVEPIEINLVREWHHVRTPDVVFLRNVLIYFDAESRAKVVKKVRQSMKPDGYIFFGTAENPYPGDENFEAVPQVRGAVFRPRERSLISKLTEGGR